MNASHLRGMSHWVGTILRTQILRRYSGLLDLFMRREAKH